jgi:hypothetical protein
MSRRFSLFLAAVALVPFLGGQTPPSQSPFVRPTNPQAAAKPTADQPSDLALSGIMAMGGSTLVCITLVAEKRSHWIKVGESAARIHVLSHDRENGRVSLKYQGQTLSLELTKPTYNPAKLAQYSPVEPSPLPIANLALDVPLTNEQKESEARHLVSDLLEIGIIQREAYKRAQEGLPPADAEKKEP